MGYLLNILYLFAFLIEVAVLFYIEVIAWRTYYTPLNFLMIPYTIVLLITIMAAGGDSGLVGFYYPSIMIWNVGLFVFAIPSFTLSFILSKKRISLVKPLESLNIIPRSFLLISFILALLFSFHLNGFAASSSHSLGSDAFATEFSGGGFWGHLRHLMMPLFIMSIYYLSKKRWWLIVVLFVFLIVSVLNQVKGWIIIPVVAGMSLRLYTGKTKLSSRLIIIVLLSAFLVFFVSYGLSILFVQNRGVDAYFLDFVIGHFVHYLTSGVLGLSMDMMFEFPDIGNFEVLWTPIINIINAISGGELMSPINEVYFNSGISLTNVRTFFGTIYIYTNLIEFVFYIFLSSTLMYFLKYATIKLNNIYIYVIYFFECALLAMGWFEFYYFHLVVFELPVLVFFLWLFDAMLRSDSELNKTMTNG